ncbi:hypothetical protein A374_07489 [Fictibacillus macauensis ZFHKF-1]|uniref:Sporulation protein YunB n=1 Tax=Fictibacillus macauensis ZFHKF-1 TaxID=1196324 RepID=I8J1P9_9BACL|nr:sporulation protein YunB [Fictibacillus macauensis]EIT85661.1 hypothetical protein A374_07489 [Fictibacillus macauensis ZFHKF-1]
MRGRMKLRKGPLPLKKVLLYSFIILIVLTLFSFWIVDEKIQPILKNIASSEVRNIADVAINDAIAANMSKIDNDKVMIVQQPKGGKPVYMPNDKMFSEVLVSITRSIHHEIRKDQHSSTIANGKVLDSVVYDLPMGAIFSNALLTDAGPKLPVEMSVIGNVDTELETKTINVGINNPSVEIYVVISVHLQVVVPFSSEKVTVKNKVKLGQFIIPQDVPDYYGGGSFQPSISAPKK